MLRDGGGEHVLGAVHGRFANVLKRCANEIRDHEIPVSSRRISRIAVLFVCCPCFPACMSVSVCLCLYLSAAGTRRRFVTAPYHATAINQKINLASVVPLTLLYALLLPPLLIRHNSLHPECTLHIVLPRSPRLDPWQPPPTAPEHQYLFLTAFFSDLPTPPERPWKPRVMSAAPWRRRRWYGVRTQQNIVAVRGSAA